MLPRVIVVLVNWNGKSDTLQCLESLHQDTYDNKQILVVDNGSTDGSAAEISARFPSVFVIETGENLGFTGGNNVGIKQAVACKADYIFLLNNDTIVEPGALTELVLTMQSHAEFGLVVPLMNYYDHPEETWFGGSQLDLVRGVAVHDNSRILTAADGPQEIPWATGCAMLLPANLADALGGFDERYFLYCEDIDLSLRMRNAGHKLALVPGARIFHKYGRSSARASLVVQYYTLRNALLFYSVHSPQYYRTIASHIIVKRMRECLALLKHDRKRFFPELSMLLRALKDHSRQRYGRYPQRGDTNVHRG